MKKSSSFSMLWSTHFEADVFVIYPLEKPSPAMVTNHYNPLSLATTFHVLHVIPDLICIYMPCSIVECTKSLISEEVLKSVQMVVPIENYGLFDNP